MPIYRLFAAVNQVLVRFAKVFDRSEASASERTWMHVAQDEVLFGVDHLRLIVCLLTPKHKYDSRALLVDLADHLV